MAAVFKQEFYDFYKVKKTNQYIETGTYRGDGILQVLDHYDTIHSIELSKKWYDYNVNKFSSNDKVIMYQGDSKVVLESVLNTINEPVTVFLDAHYSGGTTAHGEDEVPLLHELEALSKREHDDIIVIDDCRLLGKKGECGWDGKDSDGNPWPYPVMNYDWTDITLQKIKSFMKPHYQLITEVQDYSEEEQGPPDRVILIPLVEKSTGS